jgi:phospholipid/cholesterol/gamma-HCH transport system substrate-binding protein
METRAHHVLIGVFTLLVVVGFLVFIYWAGQFAGDRRFAYYDAMFEEAVTGLTTGSPVLYLGIKVGEVAGFRIDPENPNKVSVILKIEIRDDIKVREDTKASLELQGVTGTSIIQLTGGVGDSPVLPQVTSPLGDLPNIDTIQTGLSALFSRAPEVFGRAEETLFELRQLLKENREEVSQILANLARITAAFAESDDEIKRILANSADMSEELRKASARLDGLLAKEAPEALRSFSEMARDGSRLIERNEDAVSAFTERGLAQFGTFITEARRLLVSLERVAARLESDPSGFFFGRARAAEIEARMEERERRSREVEAR